MFGVLRKYKDLNLDISLQHMGKQQENQVIREMIALFVKYSRLILQMLIESHNQRDLVSWNLYQSDKKKILRYSCVSFV